MSSDTSRLGKASSLSQPLPAKVAVGSPRWWLSYRTFPVFSAPWVWRRSLLFGLVIVLVGAMSGIYHYAEGGQGQTAFQVFAYLVIGFGVMVNAGPVLAAVVRHWGVPVRIERPLVIASILVGLGLAFLADTWTSAAMMRLTDQEFEREMTGQALWINLLVLAAIYTVLGGGLALRAYLSEHRRLAAFESEQAMARLESDKLAANQQLAMLQAQIEPHFLFNTLATIRSDIREQPDKAETTLDALCDYLRATIPRLSRSDADARSTLGEQIEICRHYLTVMQSRMRTRLDYSISVEDSLADVAFPPFLLLTLVENAIRHGLEPKAAGGLIEIEAERDGDRLIVIVTDDGIGLSTEPGKGVGLSNLRQQLRLRYGDGARLRLEGRGEEGVRASIELPMENEP